MVEEEHAIDDKSLQVCLGFDDNNHLSKSLNY
jgi:hypothetical protein